jgi:hypothetical protein
MAIEYLDLFEFDDELFDFEYSTSDITPERSSSGTGTSALDYTDGKHPTPSKPVGSVHQRGFEKDRRKRKLLRANSPTRSNAFDRKVQRVAPLLVFPSYDKCDSLIYFPHAMSRHLNTANFHELSRLFCSHMDKRCQIEVFDFKQNWRMIVKFFECMNEIHPDSLMCVHSTKVVENQIVSVVHSKFTDCRKLVGALQNSANDPLFKSQVGDCSVGGVERRIAEEELPEVERQRRMGLLRTGADVVVYLKSELVLTLDSLSKLVVGMTLRSTLSSVQPVVVDLSSEDPAVRMTPPW